MSMVYEYSISMVYEYGVCRGNAVQYVMQQYVMQCSNAVLPLAPRQAEVHHTVQGHGKKGSDLGGGRGGMV
jgi:hypothetical protein